MPVSGGGFEQAYHAQAGVDPGSRLIVVNPASQHPHDQPELPPALDHLGQLPAALGQVQQVLTDNGYCREANVKACEPAGITPRLATGRAGHPPPLEARLADPGEAPNTADPVARMAPRLPTPEGKALYAQRKSTVEPVCGLIKPVMGFRQLLVRGLQAVPGEWTWVCIAYHLRRLQVLAG
jgi:hypothetical protein